MRRRKSSADGLYEKAKGIAEGGVIHDDEELDRLKYDPACYLELSEWVSSIQTVGLQDAGSPPPPTFPRPKPRPLRAAKADKTVSPWRRRVVVGAAIILVAGAGTWAWEALKGGKEIDLGNGSTNVQQDAEEAQSPQSELSMPVGSASRVGRASFQCETPGEGVQCWGYVDDEDIRPRFSIPAVEGRQIDVLTVGRGFAAAVDTEGFVWAWGVNDLGQLGRDPSEADWEGGQVGRLDERAQAIVAGDQHTCILTAEAGRVVCFGGNRAGQIRGVPTDEGLGLTAIDGIDGATALDTSGFTTWALTPEGVVAWGNNRFGQIDPEDAAETLPALLMGDAGDSP